QSAASGVRSWGGSHLRRQNAQRVRSEVELRRRFSQKFAIGFQRHRLMAGDTQMGGREIFHVGKIGVNTAHHALGIAQEVQIVFALEETNVESAVAVGGFGKELKRATIK